MSKKLVIMRSLFLGICVGIFFHYLLYRLALPLKPFIYVAF